MRNVIGVLASVLILVGVGSILQSPADTVTIPVTAAVAPDAQTITDQPTVPDYGESLVSIRTPRAGGGCSTCGPQACAPTVEKTVKVEKKIAKTKTVEVTEEATEGGRRHPVVNGVKAVGSRVRGVLGHERRVERRAGRRG
jgi:hypothetical protein